MCDRGNCTKDPIMITLAENKAFCTDHAIEIFAPGPQMGHGGFAGKSLIEKIRDDLDESFDQLQNLSGEELVEHDYHDGLTDGIAHALGILRQTSGEEEIKYALNRWKEENE